MTYTEIPQGKGRCPECGEIRSCTWTGNGALIVHGPRAARCPGSGRLPVPWLDATGLPRWDDLTDLDKGGSSAARPRARPGPLRPGCRSTSMTPT